MIFETLEEKKHEPRPTEPDGVSASVGDPESEMNGRGGRSSPHILENAAMAVAPGRLYTAAL